MSTIAKRFNEFKSALTLTQWVLLGLVCANVMLITLYVWQVNVSATRGFTMRHLEQEIHSLELEQERYELKLAELRSIDSVTTRMQMLGLVPVERVEYLTVTGDTVAINR